MRLRCRMGFHRPSTSWGAKFTPDWDWRFVQACECGAQRELFYGVPPRPRERKTSWALPEVAARKEGV